MSALQNATAVFADTGPFLRFEETLGALGLLRLLAFLGNRIHIVVDVERELDYRTTHGFPMLNALKNTPLKNEYLSGPAWQLPTSLAAQVGPIAKTFKDASAGGQRKNWGEVATVLMAASQGAAVLIDDKEGRKFARARRLDVFTTRDVAAAMASSGDLSDQDAYNLWKAVFPRHPAPRADFNAAVAAS